MDDVYQLSIMPNNLLFIRLNAHKEPEELNKQTAIYWSILNSSQGQYTHFPAIIIVLWTFILTVNEIQLRTFFLLIHKQYLRWLLSIVFSFRWIFILRPSV